MLSKHILLLLFFLLRLSTDICTGQTTIHFGKTINLLEHIQPSIVPTYGKRITGFKVVAASSELKRTMKVGPLSQIVNGMQASDAPCPFVRVETLRYGTDLVSRLDWVGNVPGNDISDDTDCICETHLAAIHFHGIFVYYSDGSMVSMRDPRLPGRIVLCPNQQDGHLISGERYFNGSMNTTLNFTLRVSDDEMSLLADIEYTMTPAGS